MSIMQLSSEDWFADSCWASQAISLHHCRALLRTYADKVVVEDLVNANLVGLGFDDARLGRLPRKLICACVPASGQADWLRCQAGVF